MIGFWKVNEPFGFMSNWYPCSFFYKNTKFTSSEQAFMWEKAVLFNDLETAAKILETTDQSKIKALGRRVRNFEQTTWDNNKLGIMYRVNLAKFFQDNTLKEWLLATGDDILAEASPLDTIWGIGLSTNHINWTDIARWQGENLLGETLMKVRQTLNHTLLVTNVSLYLSHMAKYSNTAQRQELLNNHCWFGTELTKAEQAEYEINSLYISHSILDLDYTNNIATIAILDTPCGHILHKLLENDKVVFIYHELSDTICWRAK